LEPPQTLAKVDWEDFLRRPLDLLERPPTRGDNPFATMRLPSGLPEDQVRSRQTHEEVTLYLPNRFPAKSELYRLAPERRQWYAREREFLGGLASGSLLESLLAFEPSARRGPPGTRTIFVFEEKHTSVGSNDEQSSGLPKDFGHRTLLVFALCDSCLIPSLGMINRSLIGCQIQLKIEEAILKALQNLYGTRGESTLSELVLFIAS